MNYKDLAKAIITKVKQDNIESLSHCATRLRFVLKDSSGIDKEKIKEIKGVLNVIESGGQFQVIIGMTVPQVYAEVIKIIGDNKKIEAIDVEQKKVEKKGIKIANTIFDFITGSLNPLIPVNTSISRGRNLKGVSAIIGVFRMVR